MNKKLSKAEELRLLKNKVDILLADNKALHNALVKIDKLLYSGFNTLSEKANKITKIMEDLPKPYKEEVNVPCGKCGKVDKDDYHLWTTTPEEEPLCSDCNTKNINFLFEMLGTLK